MSDRVGVPSPAPEPLRSSPGTGEVEMAIEPTSAVKCESSEPAARVPAGRINTFMLTQSRSALRGGVSENGSKPK